MDIKILGTGCQKCKMLEKLTSKMVEELGIEATVTKEEDMFKIMQYGVMGTPGLVINEKVVHSGSLPSRKELKELLSSNS